MPAFAIMAEKYADTLEDNEELQHASTCEPVDPVRSDTPTEDPVLKSEGAVETPEAPVAESPSIITESEPELCSPCDEFLQQFKQTPGGWSHLARRCDRYGRTDSAPP